MKCALMKKCCPHIHTHTLSFAFIYMCVYVCLCTYVMNLNEFLMLYVQNGPGFTKTCFLY